MKLIGLSGTNGSGKDTVGHFLAERYGFIFISMTDLLRAELAHQKLEVNRENMRTIGNKWRHDLGHGVLIDKAIDSYKKQNTESRFSGLVVSSLRTIGEAEHLHEAGGQLLWVDAAPELRYQRINSYDRGRSAEDNKSYDEFRADEKVEMFPVDDTNPGIPNMAGVRELADVQLLNETTLEQLQSDVVKALGL